MTSPIRGSDAVNLDELRKRGYSFRVPGKKLFCETTFLPARASGTRFRPNA